MILTAHPVVNSSRLTWNKDARQFVGELSDIGPMTRVYNDACDVGFTLQSQYPGRESIVFVITRVHRDRDNDVTFYDLGPADLRDRGFTVRLYND